MTLSRHRTQPVLALRGAVAAPHHGAAQAGLTDASAGRHGHRRRHRRQRRPGGCVSPHGWPRRRPVRAALGRGPTQAQRAERQRPSSAPPPQSTGTKAGHATIPSRGALACVTVPGRGGRLVAAPPERGALPWDDLFRTGQSASGGRFRRAPRAWQHGRSRTPTSSTPIRRPARRSGRTGGRLQMGEELAPTESRAHAFAPSPRAAPTPFTPGRIAERICAYLGRAWWPAHARRLRRQSPDDWVAPISVLISRTHRLSDARRTRQGFAALQILGILDGLDVAATGRQHRPRTFMRWPRPLDSPSRIATAT